MIAWGDVDAIVARVKAHLDGGADHVCVQLLTPDPASVPEGAWRELAGALATAA